MSTFFDKHEEGCTPRARCFFCRLDDNLRAGLGDKYDQIIRDLDYAAKVFEECVRQEAVLGKDAVELLHSKVFAVLSEERLSARTKNCLKNANFETMLELVRKTEAEMLRGHHFTSKGLNELKVELATHGLTFGMDV